MKDFEILEDYAVYRPTGEYHLQDAAKLLTAAINFARENKAKKLLMDIRGIRGFEPPNLANRYFFFHEWARAAQGQVYVAFVAPPEMIDPEKIGILIGENAGLTSDAFTTPDPAIAWLRNLK